MDPTQITYDVSQRYLQDRKSSLPMEVFNTLHGWIRGREHRKLASCFDLSTHDITGVEGARTLLQVESFFKKNASFAVSQETRLAALLSFEEGEELCRETNENLDDFYAQRDRFGPDLRKKISRMQRWIDKLLGPFPDFLNDLPELVEVTSGATATRSRRRALPFLRVTKRVVCTPGAFPYLEALSNHYGYGELGGRFLSRNRIAFVPKSWKTERTIACEPDGNIFLQLAFDKYAKKRLHRVGVNLRDQTRNQELAKEGSIHGNLATIDLSMASDTLSYNTVALLLPGDWFQYLRSIRSQYYEMYRDKREAYHKFSSMGNGATFALETLVFAAACAAVGSSAFSVYGDDIIIESELADDLMQLLAFLGFVPNTRKSFLSGPFRESCGKSWYRGFDITPRYLRDIDGRKSVKCHLVNSMMELSDPYGQLEEYLHSLVKEWKLPLVPYNEDSMSGVWIDIHNAYERKLIRTARKGRSAWIPRIKAYKAKARDVHDFSSRSLFLWHLRAGRRERLGDAIISTRYSISSHKYVRKWVHWRDRKSVV